MCRIITTTNARKTAHVFCVNAAEVGKKTFVIQDDEVLLFTFALWGGGSVKGRDVAVMWDMMDLRFVIDPQ